MDILIETLQSLFPCNPAVIKQQNGNKINLNKSVLCVIFIFLATITSSLLTAMGGKCTLLSDGYTPVFIKLYAKCSHWLHGFIRKRKFHKYLSLSTAECSRDLHAHTFGGWKPNLKLNRQNQ
jgi:hypothetical protein